MIPAPNENPPGREGGDRDPPRCAEAEHDHEKDRRKLGHGGLDSVPAHHAREIGNLLPNNQRQRRTRYALCHILYPVSAALASFSRMDSISTSFGTTPGTTQHVRPQRFAFRVLCDANSALFLRGAIDVWRVLVQIWYEHESTLGKFPVVSWR